MEDTKYMKNKIAYYNTPTEIVDIMLGLSSNINKSIIDTGYGDGAFINKIIEFNNLSLKEEECVKNEQTIKTKI